VPGPYSGDMLPEGGVKAISDSFAQVQVPGLA
jgi:hypothetical protein